MSHFLTNSGTTKSRLEHMKEVRANTISKWDSLGFLEGLSGSTKQNIAELYDGKASTMLNESEPVLPIVRRTIEMWKKLDEDEGKENS